MNATPPSPLASRGPLIALLGAAAALYGAFIYRSGFAVAGRTFYCLFDDAMISMRYARHVAQGLGFVWNPGEAPIEGFTNLLWTLLMAGAHWLPIHEAHTSLAVMLLGAAILLANGAAVWRLAGVASRESLFVKSAAAALTLFSIPLMFWTLRGMEVGLLALLITMAMGQTLRLRERPDAARQSLGLALACMALALLTRPDAIVPVAIIGAFAAAALPAGRARWRGALMIGVTLAGVAGALALWRVRYFGDWLPNTYYLKMTGMPTMLRVGRGWDVFGDLLRLHFWAPLGLIAAWLMGQLFKKNLKPPALMIAAVPAGMIAYSIYVGGDAWEDYGFANRYIAITLPALFVGCALGLRAAGDWLMRFVCARDAMIIAGFLAVMLLCHQNSAPFMDWIENGYPQRAAHEANTRLGLLLRAGTTPDAVTAVTWAGAIPYFSHRATIDLLGKNDRVIARGTAHERYMIPGHTKWDYAHSLRGRPDVITSLQHRGADDLELLHRLGYEQLPSGLYLLTDSPRADRAILSIDTQNASALDAALADIP